MAVPSPSPRCGFCGKGIEQSRRGGRPKDYCDAGCRRQAQRRRDRERRTSSRPPRTSWQAIVHDLSVRAQQLHAAEAGHLPLAAVLELADHLRQDAVCLAAAAVDAARREGQAWTDIASAAGVSEASARARWGGARVSRLLSERVPLPSTRSAHRDLPPPARAEIVLQPERQARGAVQDLGTALRTLHQRSGVSLHHASAVTGLPTAVIASMLEGRMVTPWAETYMLSHALGGEPQDMRLLWQYAWGEPSPDEVRDSAGRLGAALRGARLAAGYPDLTASCPPNVDVAEVRAAFEGRAVPDWPVLRDLLVALGANPSRFEPLWVAARTIQRTIAEGERSS